MQRLTLVIARVIIENINDPEKVRKDVFVNGMESFVVEYRTRVKSISMSKGLHERMVHILDSWYVPVFKKPESPTDKVGYIHGSAVYINNDLPSDEVEFSSAIPSLLLPTFEDE